MRAIAIGITRGASALAVVAAVAVSFVPPAPATLLPERAPGVAASPIVAESASAIVRSTDVAGDATWPMTTLRVVVLGAALAAARAFAALLAALLPEIALGGRRTGRASPEPVPITGDASAPAADLRTRPFGSAAPIASIPTVPRPADPSALARTGAEIRWWRGYVTSTFYAVGTGEDEGRVLAQSPTFRWRGGTPPPREPATEDALRVLVEALETSGWMIAGDGGDWFALRLRRSHEA